MGQRVITFNRSQNHLVIFTSHCNYYLKISSFRYTMTKSTPTAKTKALLWRSKKSFTYFILIATTVHWWSLFIMCGILFEENFCFSSWVGKKHDTHFLARLLYFPAHDMHRPIRRTMIFSLGILEKNKDECILILVIYWKKTGLLHTKISNHNTYNLFIIETQKIIVTATKIIYMVVFTISQ